MIPTHPAPMVAKHSRGVRDGNGEGNTVSP